MLSFYRVYFKLYCLLCLLNARQHIKWVSTTGMYPAFILGWHEIEVLAWNVATWFSLIFLQVYLAFLQGVHIPPCLLNINAYFIAYKAYLTYATTLFLATLHPHTLPLSEMLKKSFFCWERGGKGEENRVWAFNMFRTFLHYVASWSDKQTDNWHPQPPQHRTKQPQDAGKTLSLHGRHFVACHCSPAFPLSRLLVLLLSVM